MYWLPALAVQIVGYWLDMYRFCGSTISDTTFALCHKKPIYVRVCMWICVWIYGCVLDVHVMRLYVYCFRRESVAFILLYTIIISIILSLLLLCC